MKRNLIAVTFATLALAAGAAVAEPTLQLNMEEGAWKNAPEATSYQPDVRHAGKASQSYINEREDLQPFNP
jgi:hypothetical protein